MLILHTIPVAAVNRLKARLKGRLKGKLKGRLKAHKAE